MKKIVMVLLALLCAANVFAKPEFSLSWENSFLTGKISVDINDLPSEVVSVDRKVKGGQSLLMFRSKIYFTNFLALSFGIGSGANVSKLNFSYDEGGGWGYYRYIEDDALPMVYIPFFGEALLHLPVARNRLSIYAGLKYGFAISPPSVEYYEYEFQFDKGIYIEYPLGVQFNIKRFLLDVGVAYHLQKSGLIVDDGYDTETESFELKQFVVKLGLGVRFGELR